MTMVHRLINSNNSCMDWWEISITISIHVLWPLPHMNSQPIWCLPAASSTDSSLASIPPILLNAGRWIPYLSNSNFMLLISSSENTQMHFCHCEDSDSYDAFRSLFLYLKLLLLTSQLSPEASNTPLRLWRHIKIFSIYEQNSYSGLLLGHYCHIYDNTLANANTRPRSVITLNSPVKLTFPYRSWICGAKPCLYM